LARAQRRQRAGPGRARGGAGDGRPHRQGVPRDALRGRTARPPRGRDRPGLRRDAMENLARFDPEIAEAVRNETRREGAQLELIASENFVSEAVLEALGSVLTNKYAE